MAMDDVEAIEFIEDASAVPGMDDVDDAGRAAQLAALRPGIMGHGILGNEEAADFIEIQLEQLDNHPYLDRQISEEEDERLAANGYQE